jgi:hypothetical protein
MRSFEQSQTTEATLGEALDQYAQSLAELAQALREVRITLFGE